MSSNEFFSVEVGSCAPPSNDRYSVVVAAGCWLPSRLLMSSMCVQAALENDPGSGYSVVSAGRDFNARIMMQQAGVLQGCIAC